MRIVRWTLFLITIGLGAVLGLLYGWFVNPLNQRSSGMPSLRADYQADYVLMVAEAYQAESDLALAEHRLSLLGEDEPAVFVRKAINFGREMGYSQKDLEMLEILGADLVNGEFPGVGPDP